MMPREELTSIDQQAAVRVETAAGHFFERTALCAYSGHQQEVVGTVAAYFRQFLRTGGTHYKHQTLAGVPELGIHVSDGITYHALI